jgi:RNA polymerase sigma-70 factor (ECF subfamily)
MHQEEPQQLGEWCAQYRGRLCRLVAMRLDARLQGRIDPSDVVQEACLEASARYEEYRRSPVMPPFLWLRFLTVQKLALLHRHHLGTKMRNASRDVPLPAEESPRVTTAGLAQQLLSLSTTPGQAAIRAEMNRRLQEALEHLDPLDREILALRHFEELSNAEAAQVLGLSVSAGSKRYLRALKRLKDILAGLPGWTGDL